MSTISWKQKLELLFSAQHCIQFNVMVQWILKASLPKNYCIFRMKFMMEIWPESNVVLHMSRTQFNQVGSCEVRR